MKNLQQELIETEDCPYNVKCPNYKICKEDFFECLEYEHRREE